MRNIPFSAQDVLAAYDTIHSYLTPTPLAESLYLGTGEQRYFFKLESEQPVRSFKIRGALNKMCSLTSSERTRGVATVSSGNHGSAVGYAARLLGIERKLVIVPKNTPQAKIDRIVFYGGQVFRMGNNYDEAHALGIEYIKTVGMTYIDAYYEDVKIYAGQGTIAVELLAQQADVDTIVVPIGGGGLITGIAVAAKFLKPDIRIIGVQTEACPAMVRALTDHVFYENYPVTGESICDSLVGGVGKLSYEILGDYIDDIIVVREQTIRRAVQHMILNEKFVVEGGSAATLAAVFDDAERVGGRKIALVMSGGNIDAGLMLDLLRSSR